MIDVETNWWPAHSEWPPADETFRLFHAQALALLLLTEDVILLNNDGRIVPEVDCSDVFAWGCADAEDLPLLGFGDEREAPFWDLYERVRACPKWGSTQWCILRRGRRPQAPVEKRMREEGAWLPQFDEFEPSRTWVEGPA